MTEMWQAPLLWSAPDKAALWNAFLSHAGQDLLLQDGASVIFARTMSPGPHEMCVAVRLSDDHRLLVHFEQFPFKTLFGVDIEADDVALVAPALRDALLTGMATTVWAALPQADRGAIDLSGIETVAHFVGPTAPDSWEWFSVAFAGIAPDPIQVIAGCERDALLEMIGGEMIVRRAVWPQLKRDLAVPADFTLGALRTSILELRTFAAGTVIVMPASPADSCLVRAQEITHRFERADDGWICVAAGSRELEERTAHHTGEHSMSVETREPGEPGGGNALDPPIIIDFDLQRIAVPLSELESWQAGSVVALDPPAHGDRMEVTIRANGAVIGKGDVVRIDERLAVRISKLAFGG